jgi:hypothetical protein
MVSAEARQAPSWKMRKPGIFYPSTSGDRSQGDFTAMECKIMLR